MTKVPSLLIIILLTLPAAGQMITTDPAIPVVGGPVRVIYDSTKDNGDLKNSTGDLYVHTGVTANGANWQHVKGTWGNNTTQPKMRYLGNYLYELPVTPDLRTFYNVPTGVTITKICLVIRNSDGSKQTRPDIFIDVFNASLNTAITLPEKPSMIAELNDIIQFRAAATMADSVCLYLNGERVAKGATPGEVSWTFTAGQYGGFVVTSVAWDLPASSTDSVYVYVRPPVASLPLPGGAVDGINYVSDNSVTLVLHAPYKEHVFVVGDFTGWKASGEGYMQRTPDNERYWITIEDLVPRKEYRFQYLVDGELYIADPYSEKILDPWNDQYITETTYPGLISYPADTATGIVSVLQTAAEPYEWDNEEFTPPAKEKLVIYELLIRDFIEKHDYRTLIDTLGYLDDLGVNAIELMPVTEFEGNLSWGYNPSFLFAPDKYYGPARDLKEFIDSCHNRGIAVIMDMVLNHSMGQSPFVQLYLDRYGDDQIYMNLPNPWFNASSPNNLYKWGADFNHQSPSTRALVARVISHWLTEYRIDGFRFDFTKGFTNTPGDGGAHDSQRISILREIADRMREINRDAYMILEHFTANSEEKELADYGMLIWGNLNHMYAEAAMGYDSDLTEASWAARGWDSLALVTYMESHDEERLMFRNINFGRSVPGSYDTRNKLTALKRMELAALFFIPVPGPKMIWQFGELGYDISRDFNGRTGDKPIKWEYLGESERHRLYTFYKLLIWLKQNEEIFSSRDFTWSLSAPSKRMQLCNNEMCINILGNFGVAEAQVFPVFPRTGKWYDYFSGDSVTITDPLAPLTFRPGEYRLYSTKKLPSPDRILSIDDTGITPAAFARVWPNPSTDKYRFGINSDVPARVRLTILNTAGKQVSQIVSHHPGNGSYVIEWDGNGTSGNSLPAGIYHVIIDAGENRQTLKIIKQ